MSRDERLQCVVVMTIQSPEAGFVHKYTVYWSEFIILIACFTQCFAFELREVVYLCVFRGMRLLLRSHHVGETLLRNMGRNASYHIVMKAP